VGFVGKKKFFSDMGGLSMCLTIGVEQHLERSWRKVFVAAVKNQKYFNKVVFGKTNPKYFQRPVSQSKVDAVIVWDAVPFYPTTEPFSTHLHPRS
jgi:hypothetical protein